MAGTVLAVAAKMKVLDLLKTEKDFWDIVEIFAKLFGAILVPSVIAYSVFTWNSERSKLQARASMIDVAVRVLMAKETDPRNETLREWAALVLQSPSNPPRLSDEAVVALQSEGLTSFDLRTQLFSEIGGIHGPNLSLDETVHLFTTGNLASEIQQRMNRNYEAAIRGELEAQFYSGIEPPP